ncbi:RNase H domain-containing protein [Trichonephila clavipes]|nr:RNase H domain-containing protein [Trichonephila clavipes]
MKFSEGLKSFEMCTNCSSEPVTPAHILECLGLTKQDLADDPLLVLDFLKVLRELDKVCFLQWLPAHDDIAGNESADRLTKEAINLNNDNFVNITSLDANAVANFKLREKSIPVKHQIYNISGDLLITKTIARLRTGHYREMKFDRDGRRSYRNCDNCLDTELIPAHMFGYPAIIAALQKIGGSLFVNKSLSGQY